MGRPGTALGRHRAQIARQVARPFPTGQRVLRSPASAIGPIAEFEKAAPLEPPDYNLLVDWGLAYDGLNRMDDALAKLRQAAALDPTAHVYTQIGMVYAKRRHWTEAMDALDTAQKLDPSFAAHVRLPGQHLLQYRTSYERADRGIPARPRDSAGQRGGPAGTSSRRRPPARDPLH